MAQVVRDLMTPAPAIVPRAATITEVARTMRDSDIGAIIVADGDRVRGIVTDRDIAIRGVAESCDPGRTSVAEITSAQLVTVSPDDNIDRAILLMRENAVRRLPVVEDGSPVGIISIGDLAMERDDTSALAEISAAPANR